MQTDTSVIMLNTSLIIPNKYQPRKIFDENSLNTLAESIKNYGIINPILVRKKDDKYEIIAGERRFRAAQKIGLTQIPVIIKNADEQQMAELALIENLERQGLTPIEEAKSYEEIMRIGNQTQASLATKLGKSQSSIANKIRLLSLPQEVQDALANKKISERHARSLLSITDKERQLELLNKIITEKLTVKETEQIINTKEIDEEEIKKAISDIMKSLNITEEDEQKEEKKEEKDDETMNNGNFFPNFDNNNAANNNASLNMMNMQSMNQTPMMPEPEMVMPTMAPPMAEPQPMNINQTPMTPEPPMGGMPSFDQFMSQPQPMGMPDFNMNNNMSQPVNMEAIKMPETGGQQPVINDAPLFGPQPQPIENTPVAPIEQPQLAVPMMDTPLFNPNATMPTLEPTPMEQPMMPEPLLNTEPQLAVPTPFEVPVTTPQATEIPQVNSNKLSQLEDFLNANGFGYKIFGNNTSDCIIIEIPRN